MLSTLDFSLIFCTWCLCFYKGSPTSSGRSSADTAGLEESKGAESCRHPRGRARIFVTGVDWWWWMWRFLRFTNISSSSRESHLWTVELVSSVLCRPLGFSSGLWHTVNRAALKKLVLYPLKRVKQRFLLCKSETLKSTVGKISL